MRNTLLATMALLDDLPSDEVRRKRAKSRETSRRHEAKKARMKKEAQRSSTRTGAAVTKSKIKKHAANENELDFGYQVGFDLAVKYATDLENYAKLVEGKFTEWTVYHDSRKNKNGNVVLDKHTNGGVSKYVLSLNRNFNHPTRDAIYIPWVSIKPSNLKNSKGFSVGYGLFAERPFEKGDIVGVFTGELISLDESDTHTTKPYCLGLHGGSSGIDAKGGLGSEFPIGMGMHLINDPHFKLISPESNPNRHLSANMEFRSKGICVATRKIATGKELLIHYSSGGISQVLEL